MASWTPHDELIHTIQETLTIARQLVHSLSSFTCSITWTVPGSADTGEGEPVAGVGEEDTTNHYLADQPLAEPVKPVKREYSQRVLVLATEAHVHGIVERESVSETPAAIVAIEFEESADVANQVILILEAILPEFPHLKRLVVDMQVAGDSLSDILHLIATHCPGIQSYSFKHVAQPSL